jgi:hypothetical protein
MKPAPHLQLLPPLAATGGAARPAHDEALALRAREGDLAAWAEVYARHYGGCCGSCGT